MAIQSAEEFALTVLRLAGRDANQMDMARVITARDDAIRAEERAREFEADLIYYVGEEYAAVLLKTIRARASSSATKSEPAKECEHDWFSPALMNNLPSGVLKCRKCGMYQP